jgi:hypothetical protein
MRPLMLAAKGQGADADGREHAGACTESSPAQFVLSTRLICMASPPRTGTGVNA